MLSLKESNRPIAVIRGGEFNRRILYIHENEDHSKIIPNDGLNHLHGDLFKNGRNNLTQREINKIYRAIENGQEMYLDDELYEHYQKSKNIIASKNKKELKLTNGYFQVLPSLVIDQREAALISGPSGVGKSTFASEYAQMYNRVFPENKIYIFSKKDSDPIFDRFDFIERVKLDEEFIKDEPLDTKDLQKSLCIFDDIENIPNPAIKTAVYKLKDNLLETGRDKEIYLCITSHLSMNYKITRKDINECSSYIFFKNGNTYHTRRYLKDYIGLSAKVIERLLNLPSRWVLVNKNYPQYAISETECLLLN
jgi:hypothetical protein